jgi:hypothetical protein
MEVSRHFDLHLHKLVFFVRQSRLHPATAKPRFYSAPKSPNARPRNNAPIAGEGRGGVPDFADPARNFAAHVLGSPAMQRM